MIKVIIMITKLIVALTIALFLNSCNIKTDFGNGEKGNGSITTEVRKVTSDFSSIEVTSGIEVVLSQSNNKFISVQADSNLQKLIDTKIENGVLRISPNGSINPSNTVIVTVRMPKIEVLEATSGSKITGNGTFKGDNISVDATSAAEVDVNVQYDTITLDATSGGSIKASGITLKLETSATSGASIEANGLLANEVVADVTSGAIIKTHPIVSLNGDASSGGNISYDNNPKSITKDESSGGNIGKE